MLQALYFCKPFRERVLNYRLTQKSKKENLLTCLADLFHMIVSGRRRTGALQPKKFINKLRKENSKIFNSFFFYLKKKNKFVFSKAHLIMICSKMHMNFLIIY